MSRFPWTCRLALLALFGAAGAFVRSARASPAVNARDSVVRGTVRDAQTREPIAGARVRIQGVGVSHSALTGAAGVYQLPIPNGDSLHISVERYGYAPLAMDAVRLESGIRLDFTLTPEPVALAGLRVRTRSDSPRLARLMGRPVSVEAGSLPVTEATIERDAQEPFAPLVQVAPVVQTGGGGGTPSPPSATSGDALAVRGYLSRQGATLVNGAPATLAGPASYLADPFPADRSRVRLWDGGAPARVTGGLEYVAVVERLPRASGPGLDWQGRLDLVRTAAAAVWRGRRVDTELAGYATDPWTEGILGEPGHRSRGASATLRVSPRTGERLLVFGAVRDEDLPAGSASAGSAPSGSSAGLSERVGSLRWEEALGRGVLSSAIGLGRSRVSLPDPTQSSVAAPVFSLTQDRSRLAVEYRRPLGGAIEMDAGADRLGYVWRSSARSSGSVWGVWGEAAWAPLPRLGVRAGTRLDRATTDARVRPAPRLRLDWRVNRRLSVEVGSGIYHQLLPVSVPAGATDALSPHLSSAAHYRAGATMSVGAADVSLHAWLKRLSGPAGTVGRTNVWGLGLGLDAPAGDAGRLGLAALLQRREEASGTSWSPLLRADLGARVPGGARLRVALRASRSAGSLLLGGPSPDTLAVATGGSLELPGPDLRAWSVRSDVQLSRGVPWSVAGRSLRVYLQLLNVLGAEYRPLFLEGSDVRDPRVPRVLVLGLEVDPLSRTGGLER